MSEQLPKEIHFFLSSVGGVGRSSLALMSAEMLNAKVYDAYIAREFLNQFEGVDTFNTGVPTTDGSAFSYLELFFQTVVIDYFNPKRVAPEEKQVIVVDVDASLTFAFMRFLETTGFIKAFSEYVENGKCYLHFLYSPETKSRSGNDIDLFLKRRDFFLDQSVVVWVNEFKEAFMGADEIEKLEESLRSKFGEKYLDLFHICKNEAIKPLFRKRIYEPKEGIFSAYQKMNIFDKAKLRAYANFVAASFERNGFQTVRLDSQSRVNDPAYTPNTITKEIEELNTSTTSSPKEEPIKADLDEITVIPPRQEEMTQSEISPSPVEQMKITPEAPTLPLEEEEFDLDELEEFDEYDEYAREHQ